MSKLNSKQFKKKMSEMKGPPDNMENMMNVVQYASVRVSYIKNNLFTSHIVSASKSRRGWPGG